MKREIQTNPNMINMMIWAIDRAGFGLEEFALGFPRIIDWINNKKQPTFNQLEKFTQKVHLPFGFLFLEKPPQENIPFPFFRTGKTSHQTININVYDTVVMLQRRQDWMVEYLLENESESLEFVGKYNVSTSFQEIVGDIRSVLGFEEEWASNHYNWQKALDALIQRIEELGIIVVFNSVVGNNNTRPVEVKDCRGFVLVNPIAPFLFVNSADSKAAQMFTIVHELAHIWVGQSAGFDFRRMLPANDPLEQICDKIAAEFLVPKSVFEKLWKPNLDYKILARHFKVSPIVIARRALDLEKISKKEFFSFYNRYIADFQIKKKKKNGGGDFYATQKKRLSPSFLASVKQAMKSGNLMYRDAYKLTGLNGETFHTLVDKHLY